MSKDKPDAWMPLYPADWDGDTAHLTCEEDGAYGRLIRHYWRQGPPKDHDASLARIVRMQERAWKKLRPALEPFFQIADGLWRHKRVDAELIKWTAKRASAIAKAQIAAEKRWKKSDAPSIAQALPQRCPSASSTEEEGSNKPSSLRGRQDDAAHADGAPTPCAWSGPDTVRQAFVDALGEPWCVKFIDACRWQDVPDRALVPPHPVIARRILKDARPILAKLGLTLLESAA